jgi:hypothetical protein
MSMHLEDHGALDDRLIDRLVDGELAEAQRRELLARLESEPDGWRSCALAFLEAQSWRDGLSAAAGDSLAPRRIVVPLYDARSPIRRRRAVLLSALAAGFVLAWRKRADSTRPFNRSRGVSACDNTCRT